MELVLFLGLMASILVMLLLRNVVLGAAFGFILLNTLLWLTGQGAEQVGLCLLLTLLVTGTYVLNNGGSYFGTWRARGPLRSGGCLPADTNACIPGVFHTR